MSCSGCDGFLIGCGYQNHDSTSCSISDVLYICAGQAPLAKVLSHYSSKLRFFLQRSCSRLSYFGPTIEKR